MNFVLGFFKNLNLKVPAATVAGILTPIIIAALAAHGWKLPPGTGTLIVTPIIIAVIGWLTPSTAKKGS